MGEVTWGVTCGKAYLLVNDYVVAMEGDRCWDEQFKLTAFENAYNLTFHSWTLKDFKRICDEN